MCKSVCLVPRWLGVDVCLLVCVSNRIHLSLDPYLSVCLYLWVSVWVSGGLCVFRRCVLTCVDVRLNTGPG